MSDEARRAVVAALIKLAGSPDYRERVDAGRHLANFAEVGEAKEPLRGLMLDAGDTAVTRATAEALLRRQDPAGLAVVASALAAADPRHADWIHTAVLDVFGTLAGDRAAAVRACEALGRDADEGARQGTGRLTAMLAEIDPVAG
ncbi:hypothetical protein AB0K15_46060 [Amycolatopsis sp. NPDC049253]|uniref:hypothetical protein n=1 Tax=Amycolatopsis sp. NPDC049253 TaxID=3155274 RepID=UPI00342F72CF